MGWRTTTLALTAAAALAAGCADDGVGPPRKTPADTLEVRLVPLEVGARWSYRHTVNTQYLDEDGNDIAPPRELRASGVRELTRTETIAEREYVVETETIVAEGAGEPVVRWRRYRQDADGLYRADVPTTVPPESVVVGDEGVVERTRLAYPLFVGASWTVYPQSELAVVTVEALDTLALDVGAIPAYRLRVDVATDGDDDRRYLWFGAAGMLRRADHMELTAVDWETGETVHAVTDDVEELTAFDPVE